MKYQYENLRYEGRALRTRSGKLLLGPAGRRLFVDYLDQCRAFQEELTLFIRLI